MTEIDDLPSRLEPLGGVPDLFGAPLLSGLSSMRDVLTCEEEVALIDRINDTDPAPFKFQGWLGKRLTTAYGSGYDFETGRLDVTEPIPDWLAPAREQAARFAGIAANEITRALLIRYNRGAGIGWHRDRPHYEHVIGISLGASATLRFRKRKANGFERVSALLAPRSIYHLSGEARHDWEHSIAETTETRWSITFRSLSTSGLEALRRACANGEQRR